jgi:hypothetical protein
MGVEWVLNGPLEGIKSRVFWHPSGEAYKGNIRILERRIIMKERTKALRQILATALIFSFAALALAGAMI